MKRILVVLIMVSGIFLVYHGSINEVYFIVFGYGVIFAWLGAVSSVLKFSWEWALLVLTLMLYVLGQIGMLRGIGPI